MIGRIISVCLFVLSVCSCNNDQYTDNNKSIVIDLQPFDGIPAAHSQYVLTELKKHYPLINLNNTIALPKSAYYAARNRYRADSLIGFLKTRTSPGRKTIGLTNKDISTTKNGIADWGVMGLGFCPGNACVASTFRLSKSNTQRQLFKVSIHELGHTFGLPHCPVSSCFMRDAEGTNPTDEENGFCKTCKTHLINKGWRLN